MNDARALKIKLDRSVHFLRKKLKRPPELALFMGTGLGTAASWMTQGSAICYDKIPGFPRPSAFGQENAARFGSISGKYAVSFEGRFHVYEGHSFHEIGFPVRVAHALGAKTLIATNIAGGINLSYRCGDLILIEDHLNLMTGSPLAGPHEPWMGERFVDLSEPYDGSLLKLARAAAAREKIALKRGGYAAVTGPQLETRAEYRYLKKIGADLVGMSTVPEVLVARQLGMKVLAISVVSDECDPDNLKPINVPKILDIAKKAQGSLSKILGRVISNIGK